jgi:hypothetical protein
MRKKSLIVILRIIHTTVWVILSSYIMYILYAAIINKINKVVWIGILLIIIEGMILLLYKWRCPITVWVEKLSDNYVENTDIYLPKWLAKNTKTIFTTIYLIAILIILFRIFIN